MPRSKTRYTAKRLQKALKKLVAEQGEDVTLAEFTQATGISITPICRLFGSWSRLRRAVGLSHRGKSDATAVLTHEQVREKLTEAVLTHGESITLEQFLCVAGISATPIYHLFGSWTALQESVGLRSRWDRVRASQQRPWQMAAHVRGIMQDSHPPTTIKELAACSGLSRREVEAEFGSWEEFCQLLFIESRNGGLHRLSDEELLGLMKMYDRNEPEVGRLVQEMRTDRTPAAAVPTAISCAGPS